MEPEARSTAERSGLTPTVNQRQGRKNFDKDRENREGEVERRETKTRWRPRRRCLALEVEDEEEKGKVRWKKKRTKTLKRFQPRELEKLKIIAHLLKRNLTFCDK